jgi:hypothetical protein
MKALQTIAEEFAEGDIYNMDETGLFWKRCRREGYHHNLCPV